MLSTKQLINLETRLGRSIDELTAYRAVAVRVLKAREYKDHPLFGIYDQGEDLHA